MHVQFEHENNRENTYNKKKSQQSHENKNDTKISYMCL
jgi:hypothetical protein